MNLTIDRLHDPLVESRGVPITSPYAERFWLPTVGPTALWLLRWAERNTTDGAVTIDDAELAGMLGVGTGKGSRRPSLDRTLDRVVLFGCGTAPRTGLWRLRSHLAPLTQRQVEHLPERLQREHADLITALAR